MACPALVLAVDGGERRLEDSAVAQDCGRRCAALLVPTVAAVSQPIVGVAAPLLSREAGRDGDARGDAADAVTGDTPVSSSAASDDCTAVSPKESWLLDVIETLCLARFSSSVPRQVPCAAAVCVARVPSAPSCGDFLVRGATVSLVDPRRRPSSAAGAGPSSSSPCKKDDAPSLALCVSSLVFMMDELSREALKKLYVSSCALSLSLSALCKWRSRLRPMALRAPCDDGEWRSECSVLDVRMLPRALAADRHGVTAAAPGWLGGRGMGTAALRCGGEG